MTRQAAFYCGLAMFVAVGTVCGNYYLTTQLLSEHATDSLRFDPQTERFQQAGIQPGVPPAIGQANSVSGPNNLPDNSVWSWPNIDEVPAAVSSTSDVPMLASSAVPIADSNANNNDRKSASVPKPLAPPEDAVPIGPANSATNQAICAIIEQELPNASREAKQIWFEELAGLSPAMVREILQLRTHFNDHSLPPRLAPTRKPNTKDQGSPTAAARRRVPRELAARIGSDFPAELQAAAAAIRQAQLAVLQNIANANTAGYKSLRVLMPHIVFDSPHAEAIPVANVDGETQSASAVAAHPSIIAQTVHAPGPLVETGRELDIAVEGSGWFRIRYENENLYTRVGAFQVDQDGHVVLVRSGKAYVLQPKLTVPDGTSEIHVAADGHVSIRSAAAVKLTEIGRIELAHFINPDGLERRDENLFAETEQSGVLRVSAPGHAAAGTLHQRFLEASNVNVGEELSNLKRLTRQMHALEEAATILAGQTSKSIGE